MKKVSINVIGGLLVLQSMVFSMSVKAEELLTIKVTTTSTEDSSYLNNGEGVYSAALNDGISTTKIEGEGVFAMINKEETKRDTDVVGIDSEGYDRISLLSKSDDVWVVQREFAMTMDFEGELIEIGPYTQTLELELVAGSIEGYENGSTVRLRATDDGNEQLMEVVDAQLRVAFKNMEKKFREGGLDVRELTFDGPEVLKRGGFFMNKDQISLRGGKTRYEFEFKVPSPL